MGYASLRHILAVRPQLVKLDRALVEGLDGDGAKNALVEMLGTFASRTDAWIVAEGVERREELDALVRIGVPLGQGYLLGRPSPPFAELEPALGVHIRGRVEAKRSSSAWRRFSSRPGPFRTWTGARLPPHSSWSSRRSTSCRCSTRGNGRSASSSARGRRAGAGRTT